MPPKPKLTKKQQRKLERERQEEARRLKEEEEAKKKAEEEERLRIKMEKQKQKEAVFAEEEKVRLSQEESELAQQILKHRQAINTAEKEINERLDWERFMQCEGQADPNKETDITGLLCYFKDLQIEEKLKINEFLNSIQEVENLNQELIRKKQKLRIENDQVKINLQDDYINEFRIVTLEKIRQVTAHLIINSDTAIQNRIDELKKVETSKYKQTTSAQDQAKMDKPEVLQTNKGHDFGYGCWIWGFERTGPRPTPIDFKELEIKSEVPRTLVSTKQVMSCFWSSYDYLSDSSIYSEEMVLGGIVSVNCYHFIIQPEEFAPYKIRRILSEEDAQNKHQYPIPDSSGQVNYSTATPVRIFYTLPKYLYVHPDDKIKVVLYDEKEKHWSQERIANTELNHETKQLTIATLDLAPLAYIQKKNLDFPYKSWKQRCLGDDRAVLDIIGQRISIRFEIINEFVYLRNRPEPELAHIVDQPFTPHEILCELKKSGIHLQPEDEDIGLCGIPLKSKDAEYKAQEDISMAVRSFYIESTKWNNHLPTEQVACRIRYNPEFDEEFLENQEKDWYTISWWDTKCSVLRIKESQENPNTKRVKGTLTHSNLQTLLRNADLSDFDTLNRFNDLHYILFMGTLKKFLMHIRLQSFTTDGTYKIEVPKQEEDPEQEKAEKTEGDVEKTDAEGTDGEGKGGGTDNEGGVQEEVKPDDGDQQNKQEEKQDEGTKTNEKGV